MTPKEINEGWVDDWEIRNKEDCHPSSAIHVISIGEIMEELNKFIDEHIFIASNLFPKRPKLIRIPYHEWDEFRKELFKE